MHGEEFSHQQERGVPKLLVGLRAPLHMHDKPLLPHSQFYTPSAIRC